MMPRRHTNANRGQFASDTAEVEGHAFERSSPLLIACLPIKAVL
jgi:hypothetical protein